MPLRAKFYIALVLTSGLIGLTQQLLHFAPPDPFFFWLFFGITVLTSGVKVRLPMVTVTLSVNFLFILVGIVKFPLPEALAIAAAGTIVQCVWQAKARPRVIQVAFSTCSICLAVIAGHEAYHGTLYDILGKDNFILLGLTATVYFVVNTVLVAAVVALTENKSIYKTWVATFFWAMQYHLAAAMVAWQILVLEELTKKQGWQAPLVFLVLVGFVYYNYKLHLTRLENDKVHVEELAGLHLRTIEALALAIEAKDSTTHDHLQRVRIYATEIGREMNMVAEELDALQAAALLHDIGKLAVPEHIISKPGKLTPEEFEKMKIHPIVGAEILQRVQFPYPVVPIVRAHHERWDGSGYPFGLRGEEIPIGARILAAVDCLDALASDRQYRRALPLDDAMRHVEMESGISFDPQVVTVLKQHYQELERKAQGQDHPLAKLSTDVKVEKGVPAAGLEHNEGKFQQPAVAKTQHVEFLSSIASARQEAQMLFELSQTIGNSLSLDETLSVLSVRLKRLIPYDSIAIYCKKDDRLVPEFVTGDNFRLFSSLQIPMGQGLSGWVAQNRKAIVNGNPSVEPGYLADDTKFSTLRSALAVPLEGLQGVLGVLALYHADKDAFTNDHLRILLAIASKLGLSIENALKYRLAETSATTDYLTGLPNARSLFLHLDREMSRCRRHEEALTVLVCDLDGFKQVNDRFGHLEGNRLLRAFAQKLKDSCREYDYVARMGGDEFVIVAPGLTPETSLEKTYYFNQLAMEAGRQVTGEDIISLSVGAAFYPRDGRDAEQLLAEADRRMYVVKQQH